MKYLLSMAVLWSGLLLASIAGAANTTQGVLAAGAPAHAPRPCTLSTPALRGTYTFTGNAWQDLSEISPALPKGYAPVSIIGAFRLDGNGDVTGWAAINAGGLRLTATFVDSHFGAPQSDCSVPITLSMKIGEFGEAVTGPYSYVGVIGGNAPALEIDFMMLGTAPGSHVELNHAKRISKEFD